MKEIDPTKVHKLLLISKDVKEIKCKEDLEDFEDLLKQPVITSETFYGEVGNLGIYFNYKIWPFNNSTPIQEAYHKIYSETIKTHQCSYGTWIFADCLYYMLENNKVTEFDPDGCWLFLLLRRNHLNLLNEDVLKSDNLFEQNQLDELCKFINESYADRL
jgi:hypothetical protein